MDGPSLQESRCYFAVCQEEQANFILIRAQAAAPGAGVYQGGRGRGRGPPQVQAMGGGVHCLGRSQDLLKLTPSRSAFHVHHVPAVINNASDYKTKQNKNLLPEGLPAPKAASPTWVFHSIGGGVGRRALLYWQS